MTLIILERREKEENPYIYRSEQRSLDQLQSLRIRVGLFSHPQMSIYSNRSIQTDRGLYRYVVI
jgi:hypothetical protein